MKRMVSGFGNLIVPFWLSVDDVVLVVSLDHDLQHSLGRLVVEFKAAPLSLRP